MKKVFLADENTARLCLPRLGSNLPVITIPAGEAYKSPDTVMQIWHAMEQMGLDRYSTLVNVGGGVVCDLGGFAAATFKRGIQFINIPTTLLAMVDAAEGGKTGFNFDGLKNQIGLFAQPTEVVINTDFLGTLPHEELMSGAAEMLKHGLVGSSIHWAETITFNWEQPDFHALEPMIERSREIKKSFTEQDPLDKGLRKALNLGHTFAHAFEEWALEKQQPLRHGHAVALGLVCALYASVIKFCFPSGILQQTAQWVKAHFSPLGITCDDYPRLKQFMLSDKKNNDGTIRFTLLKDMAQPCVDQVLSDREIFEAFDFLREG